MWYDKSFFVFFVFCVCLLIRVVCVSLFKGLVRILENDL